MLSAILVLIGQPSSALSQTSGGPDGNEVLDLRTATTKTFAVGDGRFRTIAYSSPVHFLDDSGTWQDIDARWRAVDNRIENGQSDIRLSFARSGADPILGRVSIDESHSLAFGLSGA